MKKGLFRFTYHLDKLEGSLQQASKEKNPALWLYNNNVRTTAFMLEALSRLNRNLYDSKFFEKCRIRFKSIEDGIGVIDYYSAYALEFNNNARIPAEIANYLQGQAREKIQHLNDLLITEDWIGENPSRITKIKKKLEETDWKKEKNEVKQIADFYTDAILEINVFVDKTGFNLNNIENQVHELRRKIRWLSIYPHALLGAIQLTDNNINDPKLGKYLTPEILNSPFNKLPEPGDCNYELLLEKDYYLALSWLIDALGKLKDKGLGAIAIAEALQQIEKCKPDDAIEKAYEMLGESPDTKNAILTEASQITKDFFYEKYLDKLLHSIEEVEGVE
jgi:hypothetical protein